MKDDAPNIITYQGITTTLDELRECERIVGNCLENLSDQALRQMLGGYQSDIDSMVTSMVVEALKVTTTNKRRIDSEEIVVLEHVTSELTEQIRRENMNFFVSSVFGDEVEVNWHHIEWGQMASLYSHIALLASRDHGKSYWWSNLYPCWQMYKFDPKDPIQVRHGKNKGFVFSHTEDKAIDFLDIIKDTIATNPILSERLSVAQQKRWNKKEIKTRNGCQVKVKGFMSNARGFHPSWIVVDDPLHDNVIYSPTQREKTNNFFHSVITNMLVPKGQLICVGTPFHDEDLYSTFREKERRKIWHYAEYPAIFPNGKVLWPNRYSFDDLLTKKATQGNLIFSREFLCRPIASESSLFPYALLNTAIAGMEEYTMVNNIEAFPVDIEYVVSGHDFAISGNVKADYTVFTVWGIDSSKNMWLLHAWRKLGASFNEQIGRLKSVWQNYRPEVMVLENNNFQEIYNQYLRGTDMPIKPHTTGTVKHKFDKGLPSMTTLFERNKIKLPYGDTYSKNMVDILLTEFNNITFTDKGVQSIGGHDDFAMSTWLGRRGMMIAEEGSFDFAMI